MGAEHPSTQGCAAGPLLTHPAQIQVVPSQGLQPLCRNCESCLALGLLTVVAPFHALPPAEEEALICSFSISSAFPWPLLGPCIFCLSARALLAAPAQ